MFVEYICMFILDRKKKKESREYLTQISLRHATLMANFLFVSATAAALPPLSLYGTHPRVWK